MKMKAASSNYEPVPAGKKYAILNSVIDLGVQVPKGRYSKAVNQVLLNFELPGVTYENEDGNTVPRNIHTVLTNSAHSKSRLRALVHGMLGKSLTDVEANNQVLEDLLGTGCFLEIVHNQSGDKTYANINSAESVDHYARSMPDDETAQKVKDKVAATNAHYEYWHYEIDEPSTHDVYKKLPEWLQTIINDRVQSGNGTSDNFKDDRDIPF